MALTTEEVAKIIVDLLLGRKLRVTGKEAEEMAKELKIELDEMKVKKIITMIPN